MREPEQHRIDTFGNQRKDGAALGVAEAERAGERGERPAALGIGRCAQILRDQSYFGIAPGLVSETVEEFGERVHLFSPPPCGEVDRRRRSGGVVMRITTTPLPDPPPQGGGN